MKERVEIAFDSKKYLVRPLKDQGIKDGLVRVDGDTAEGAIFRVDKENRQKVLEALEEIEKVFSNPSLAVTDKRLRGWSGAIERYLIPPVEVVGPPILMITQEA